MSKAPPEFVVFGVRVVEQKRKNGLLDARELKRKIGDTVYGHGRGVYVFGLRRGKGSTPWYVGRATKQSFANECCSDNKMSKYKDALILSDGTPVLCLLHQDKHGRGKFHETAIKSLEKELIAIAYAANPELLNKQHLPRLITRVKGSLRRPQGKPSQDGALLRGMLNLG